jgi:leader peptidase (prepilin peptidase)/N-methyltransferase
MVSGEASGWSLVASTRWVAPVALALAAATFVRLGMGPNAVAWGVVQIVLVVLAAHDIATRRLPNVVTVPVSLVAVALRVSFERPELVKVVLAGVIAFLVFFVFSVVLRGGFGMGDVKLAAMLGFLLGGTVVGGLAIGIVAGGLASIALLATSHATLRSSIAYGPYLAFGGAIAILALHPPALV